MAVSEEVLGHGASVRTPGSRPGVGAKPPVTQRTCEAHPCAGLRAIGRVAFFLRLPALPACRAAWGALQQSVHLFQLQKGTTMSISLILLIVLILILIGVLPTWGHSRSWGYGPSGGVGLVVVILLILLLMGRI